MSGLSAVIARIDAIESQIVSLGPTATAAETAASTDETRAAAATTFAGALESVKTASSTEPTSPVDRSLSTGGIENEAASTGDTAGLVSMLQTLFSAGSSGTSGSALSMQKLVESIG